MPQYSTLKMPIGQTRLVYAIFMAVPIAVFMYMATVNLHWLTINRLGYVFYGVLAGLLLGVVESRIVLSRLSKACGNNGLGSVSSWAGVVWCTLSCSNNPIWQFGVCAVWVIRVLSTLD